MRFARLSAVDAKARRLASNADVDGPLATRASVRGGVPFTVSVVWNLVRRRRGPSRRNSTNVGMRANAGPSASLHTPLSDARTRTLTSPTVSVRSLQSGSHSGHAADRPPWHSGPYRSWARHPHESEASEALRLRRSAQVRGAPAMTGGAPASARTTTDVSLGPTCTDTIPVPLRPLLGAGIRTSAPGPDPMRRVSSRNAYWPTTWTDCDRPRGVATAKHCAEQRERNHDRDERRDARQSSGMPPRQIRERSGHRHAEHDGGGQCHAPIRSSRRTAMRRCASSPKTRTHVRSSLTAARGHCSSPNRHDRARRSRSGRVLPAPCAAALDEARRMHIRAPERRGALLACPLNANPCEKSARMLSRSTFASNTRPVLRDGMRWSPVHITRRLARSHAGVACRSWRR